MLEEGLMAPMLTACKCCYSDVLHCQLTFIFHHICCSLDEKFTCCIINPLYILLLCSHCGNNDYCLL